MDGGEGVTGAQLAEYHKLATTGKLIPIGADNFKGYDFKITLNPEVGGKCLVKYRAQCMYLSKSSRMKERKK